MRHCSMRSHPSQAEMLMHALSEVSGSHDPLSVMTTVGASSAKISGADDALMLAVVSGTILLYYRPVRPHPHHICTVTGLPSATSAPGLGSPHPQLHRA